MRKLLFIMGLALTFGFIACDKKGTDTGKTTTDSTGIQQITEDTLDEFEYEADSVETDDDEDI
jgi:hypothetical protein